MEAGAQTIPNFGTRIYTRGIVLKGLLPVEQWLEFIAACVRAVGMTAFGEPAVWQYPEPEGDGPQGFVIVQPLTESFLALDVWPVHRCAYLFITSCKKFAMSDVAAAVLNAGLGCEDLSASITLRLRE